MRACVRIISIKNQLLNSAYAHESASLDKSLLLYRMNIEFKFGIGSTNTCDMVKAQKFY